jgi:heptosyltransferase-2
LEVAEGVEGSGLVALAPGAKWPEKQWPEEYFGRLGGDLVEEGLGVLLVGSREEKALLERIASGIARDESVMVVAGDLRLLASLFSISSAAVCNDSGLMHLAAAVDTPTIGIFGPTAPHFGFQPFGGQHRTMWIGLDCSPCSLHGEKRCWKSEKAPCMRLMGPDKVYAALRAILKDDSAEQGIASETVRGKSKCGM